MLVVVGLLPSLIGVVNVYGYGGGVIVRVTGGLSTPGEVSGLGLSVMTKGGGRTLLVT